MVNSQDNLLALWNNYANAGYDNLYKSYSFQRITKIMGKMFQLQSDGIILDGGCGTGNIFKFIVDKIQPKKIVAIDWSTEMLKQAKIKALAFKNIVFDFYQVDMTKKYPFPDNFFNAIVYNISICYFPHSGWQNAILEGKRILKKDGYIYISTFLKGWEFSEILKKHKFKAFKESLIAPRGLYYGLKLKKYAEKITTEAKKQGMLYPDRIELNQFIKKLGFEKIEEHDIFWGAGVALKVKKK